MVEVKNPLIVDRENEFVADEISFLNFVVSDYSNPTIDEPEEQARKEYEKETKEKLVILTKQLDEEAKDKNLKDDDSRTKFIENKIKKYEEENYIKVTIQQSKQLEIEFGKEAEELKIFDNMPARDYRFKGREEYKKKRKENKAKFI